MSNRKTLQELTIKDNFLFAAVMMEPENCKGFLEMTLGFEIARVEVSYEKSIVYHPEYKGIRLDVYAKDERNTHYNVEIQVYKRRLEKRTRYYHSQMDMELLLAGTPYERLPDSYVIFVCDFDPFGCEKYVYTIDKVCREEPGLNYQDGCHSIFLSTEGKNAGEVPESLVKFLRFVKADLPESMQDFEDVYVSGLQRTIRRIKESREMGEHYMVFEEMMREEREQGRVEGKVEGKVEAILEILEGIDAIPEDLKQRIMTITDLDMLKQLLSAAISAESMAQFSQMLETISK